MLDKGTLVKVKNRDNGTVGYTIPDLGNLHRSFQVGETKEVTMDELRKLSYIPGGEVLLRDCLLIENDEAIDELLGTVEPEYKYTEKEIKYILEEGSMDEFLDTLDFAPKGVIDMIKDLAVKTKLNNVEKRNKILEKTGFNVTKAIQLEEETESEEDKQANEKVRRTTPTKATEETDSSERRSNPVTSRYKVVSKGK